MSCLKKFFLQLNISGKISLFIILFLILISLFSPYIMKYPHNVVVGSAFEHPSMLHYLGTDDLGMDVFSQIIFGARISILISFVVSISSGFIGTVLGIFAGYYEGILERVLMRLIDVITIIPTLPLIIIIASFFGPSLINIIIILISISWINLARITRAQIKTLKNKPYITLSKSFGANFWYISKTHFFPSIFPITSIHMIRQISRTIISEASLSFLGLGDPTNKTWGLILNFALSFEGIYFTDFWKWWVLSPLVSILILVLSFAFFSNSLEKVINTKV